MKTSRLHRCVWGTLVCAVSAQMAMPELQAQTGGTIIENVRVFDGNSERLSGRWPDADAGADRRTYAHHV